MKAKTGKSVRNNGGPDRFKVALTTYQFEREAEFWWGTIKPREGEHLMTWDRLVELLNNKYYP